jgi:hypothetical protein
MGEAGDIITETVADGDMVLGVCVRRAVRRRKAARRRIGTKLHNTGLTGLHSTDGKSKPGIGGTRLVSRQC